MSNLSSGQVAFEQAHTAANDVKRQSTIDALTKLYRLFAKLPYIPPECLMIPPETGWTTIDEVELRRRGKTEGVIDMLRNLPYLKQKGNPNKWTLASSTVHINYAEGEMYRDWIEDTSLKLPGHVIWLTELPLNDGIYWLLDTETQDAIEFRPSGDNLEVDYETSEAVPRELQWTIQTRMPAARYFDLWRHKYETLDFLVIPDSRQIEGTAECFYKLLNHLWKESLWPSEDEENDEDYNADDTIESSSGSSDEDSDEDLEEDDADWELLEDINEIEWLEKDKSENPFLPFAKFQDGNPRRLDTLPLEGCRRSILFCNGAPGQEVTKPPSDYLEGPRRSEHKDTKALLKIFARHGWPLPLPSESISSFRPFPAWGKELDVSGFDRDSCYSDLVDFMQARHAKKKKEREKQEQNEMTLQLERVTFIRHKLQKTFLQSEVVPTEDDLSKASELLDEFNNTFFEEENLQKSKILKVLKAALRVERLAGDDQYKLRSRIQLALDNYYGIDSNKYRSPKPPG